VALASRSVGVSSGQRSSVSTTAKERQVLQLLKDYRSWHTAFGGSLTPEDSHMRSAAYGPAALIEQGAYWPKRWRAAARTTYEKLEHALTLLQHDGTLGMSCWLVLHSFYLGADADPSEVERLEKTRPNLKKWRDLAVKKVAGYLAGHDLFVIMPSRMTSNAAKQIDLRNDEAWALYQQLRSEGRRKTEAVKTTAILCGYSERRIWEIVKTRGSASEAKPA
jgi:hypothetical protein